MFYLTQVLSARRRWWINDIIHELCTAQNYDPTITRHMFWYLIKNLEYLSINLFPLECNAEVIWTVQGTFTWDATRVGRIASHRCPYGPRNVTLTRACHLKSSSSASWEKFDSSTCDPSKRTETLLSLSKVWRICTHYSICQGSSPRWRILQRIPKFQRSLRELQKLLN